MNILQITSEFPPNVLGGVAYHSYNLAHAFVESGHSVTVLTTNTGTHGHDNSVFNFENITINRIDIPDLPGTRLWFDRSVRAWLAQIDLTQFDVIHSHEYVAFDRVSIPVPIILKVHVNLSKELKYWTGEAIHPVLRPLSLRVRKQLLRPKERALERRALKHSDSRVYISELTKRIAESADELSDRDHKIVHNAVDLSVFSPPLISKTSTDSEADDYFLYVGGDARRKGFDLLVEAIDQRSDDLDAPVKMVGDFDKQRDDVRRAAAMDAIELLGRVDQNDLVGLYRGAQALVHPARYEPFGNVVIESLACGTPVVVSDPEHCGAAELVTDDVGTIVSPSDPMKLVDAMHTVEERIQPGVCRGFAEKRSWGTVAKETLTLLD